MPAALRLYCSVSYSLVKTCVPVRESTIDSTNDSFAISLVALHDARRNREAIPSIVSIADCWFGVKFLIRFDFSLTFIIEWGNGVLWLS